MTRLVSVCVSCEVVTSCFSFFFPGNFRFFAVFRAFCLVFPLYVLSHDRRVSLEVVGACRACLFVSSCLSLACFAFSDPVVSLTRPVFVCLSVCRAVCRAVWLSVGLSGCLSGCLSVGLSVCRSLLSLCLSAEACI